MGWGFATRQAGKAAGIVYGYGLLATALLVIVFGISPMLTLLVMIIAGSVAFPGAVTAFRAGDEMLVVGPLAIIVALGALFATVQGLELVASRFAFVGGYVIRWVS